MADEPKMLFYDDDGKRVSENSPQARRQFLSDDPLRPDAPPEERAAALSTVFGDRTKPSKLLYYDAEGKRVAEGSPEAVRQFLADDPNRPDAAKDEPATGARTVTTSTSSTQTTATKTDADPDPLAARRALVARAKELGLSATGKSDELAARIAEAEGKAKSGPDETKARTSPSDTKGE